MRVRKLPLEAGHLHSLIVSTNSIPNLGRECPRNGDKNRRYSISLSISGGGNIFFYGYYSLPTHIFTFILATEQL